MTFVYLPFFGHGYEIIFTSVNEAMKSKKLISRSGIIYFNFYKHKMKFKKEITAIELKV